MKKKKVAYLPKIPKRKGKITLREGDVWVEKQVPHAIWVIEELREDANGTIRVYLKTLRNERAERSYSESYFRRHWDHRLEFIRKQNEAARRRPAVPAVVLYKFC